MNWYKRSQGKGYDQYTDIGHYFWHDRLKDKPANSKEILWLIDENWDLHWTEHHPGDPNTHMDMWDNTSKGIAVGRIVATPEKTISSSRFPNWQFLHRIRERSPFALKQKERYKRRIEQMLRSQLDVNEVHFFDDF